MVELNVRMSPFVNLIYHLERGSLSGRWKIAPVEEYRTKALKITDRLLLDRFYFLLDQENIHSVIIKGIEDSCSVKEAQENLATEFCSFSKELSQAIRESWPDYLQHFSDNIVPDLRKFEKKLRKLIPEIQRALVRLENSLGLRWNENYTVHLVGPTSESYQPCGDIVYGETIVVEAHQNLDPKQVVSLVVHEMSHVQFDSMILEIVPEKLRTDFEYVREAVVFLIENTCEKYVDTRPRPEMYEDQRGKRIAFYAAKFWDKWHERLCSSKKHDTFPDFLSRLLSSE